MDYCNLSRGFGTVGAAVGDGTAQNSSRLMTFALAWFVFPLVFFSFSGSKLPGYILPVLPAAAVIVGRQLRRLHSDSGSWPLRTTAAIYLLFAIGAIAYSWRTGNLSLTTALLLAAPLLVAGCFPFSLLADLSTSVALMAAMTVVALIVVMYRVAPTFAEHESSSRLFQLADAAVIRRQPSTVCSAATARPSFMEPAQLFTVLTANQSCTMGPVEVIEEAVA